MCFLGIFFCFNIFLGVFFLKRFLFLFVFFVCFFSFVSAGTPFYLLSVKDSVSTVPVKPFSGDLVSLVVNVENVSSSSTAFDVNARVQLNSEIFEIVDDFESLGSIESKKSKQLAFRFKIHDIALPGQYTVPVELSYFNGTSFVLDFFDVNLVVNECFGLDVSDVSYLPSQVYAGKQIVLSSSVENVCSGVARNVSVELAPSDGFSFDSFILLSSNVVELGNILPRESKNVSFVLQPISNAVPQVYVFELKAGCLDCSGVTSDKVSFEVLGVPWVIVSGTDFSVDLRADAKNLLQGDVFSFSVQVDNIGKEKARAVKVLLDFGEDESIVGVTSAFVGNVDPEDSGAAIFDLTVSSGAFVGEHPVKILIEFVDETGNPKVVVQDFVFFVNQRPSESPVFFVFLLIVLLVVLFFVLRLVFRQLSLRKANLK